MRSERHRRWGDGWRPLQPMGGRGAGRGPIGSGQSDRAGRRWASPRLASPRLRRRAATRSCRRGPRHRRPPGHGWRASSRGVGCYAAPPHPTWAAGERGARQRPARGGVRPWALVTLPVVWVKGNTSVENGISWEAPVPVRDRPNSPDRPQSELQQMSVTGHLGAVPGGKHGWKDCVVLWNE